MIRRLDLVCGPAPVVPGLWLFGSAHRSTILAALEDAAWYRTDQDSCWYCGELPDGQKCGDHAVDDSIARMYDDLAVRLQERLWRRPRNRFDVLGDAVARAEVTRAARETR